MSSAGKWANKIKFKNLTNNSFCVSVLLNECKCTHIAQIHTGIIVNREMRTRSNMICFLNIKVKHMSCHENCRVSALVFRFSMQSKVKWVYVFFPSLFSVSFFMPRYIHTIFLFFSFHLAPSALCRVSNFVTKHIQTIISCRKFDHLKGNNQCFDCSKWAAMTTSILFMNQSRKKQNKVETHHEMKAHRLHYMK